MKKSKPEQIADIIERVIAKAIKNRRKEQKNIESAWLGSVDEKIKKHTKICSLKDKTLRVNVDSSAWLFELRNRHKKDILAKLKQKAGEKTIKDIRFKIGEV